MVPAFPPNINDPEDSSGGHVLCEAGTLKVHAVSCTDTSAVSKFLVVTQGANNARIHMATVIGQ